jgi:hypothetical protein
MGVDPSPQTISCRILLARAALGVVPIGLAYAVGAMLKATESIIANEARNVNRLISLLPFYPSDTSTSGY